MVRVFPISSNQPNEMALTICNSISRNCFRLMRDRKLESLANGKEISAVPFRTEKEDFLWRKSKISVPFTFQPKYFRIFSPKQEKNQKEEDTAVLKRHLTRVNLLFVRHFTYQNKGNLLLFLILAVHL